MVQQYYKIESIHLNSWPHNHKKQKSSPETQVIFEELLGENDFEAFSANFCCYDYYGANASEAVQKITKRTLELYANSLKPANFKATLMKKHI